MAEYITTYNTTSSSALTFYNMSFPFSSGIFNFAKTNIAMENNIITASSITDIDTLLGYWKAMSGNSRKTKDDFFHFLTTPGQTRDNFLARYCTATVRLLGDIIIHKVIPQP